VAGEFSEARVPMMDRRNARGFTLIELLIVIVIIGILATIAIPKFSSSKEQGYLAAMKSDLRNLATMEESYMYEFLAYTNNPPTASYEVTTGVIGPTVTVTSDGWTAFVAHNVSTKSCAIYFGTTIQAPATKEGVPKCST
jgi:prepilin-type N-terminal cleavage/methylation domain-containing protein